MIFDHMQDTPFLATTPFPWQVMFPKIGMWSTKNIYHFENPAVKRGCTGTKAAFMLQN